MCVQDQRYRKNAEIEYDQDDRNMPLAPHIFYLNGYNVSNKLMISFFLDELINISERPAGLFV